MPYKDKEKQREAWRRYYNKNADARAKMYTTRRNNKDRNYAFLASLKDVPCADCGQKYPPYVMDFDHIDDKVGNLSKMANSGVSIEVLTTESAKCEVVCSNCHRIRTYNSLGWKDYYMVGMA